VPVASHRVRYVVLAFVLTWMALLLLTRPAQGAWSADPVEVHATSALCPAVSAVDDSHFGAIIVWQENTANGGLLQARHVLANGDLDPSWSGPAAVSNLEASRLAIGAVSDGAGGAYVWWMENTALFLNHLTSAGTVAAGWVARGRNVGNLPTTEHRPVVLADGEGGVYLGWLSRPFFFDPTVSIRVVRLGPTGAGAGGWPSGGRAFGLVGDAGVSVSAFGIDTAPGDGLWLGWQTVLPGPDGSYLPGALRALRLGVAGLPAEGWTSEGVMLATYDASFINFAPGWQAAPAASQTAVAHDASNGAFIVASQGVTDGNELVFHNTLRHVDAVGQPAAGWALEGVNLGDVYASGIPDPGAQGSLRAVADHQGGVFAGLPFFASEFTSAMTFSRRSATGESIPGGVGAAQRGIEVASRGDGGLFVAAFKPSGATSVYDADAYISVSQSDPGAGFYESKTSYSATRYGDVGLTATGDGGAIFAWSQLIDRQGIYAIRLGQAGAVTGAPPMPPIPMLGSPRLRAQFVRGEGVHAVATIAGSTRVRFALLDVSGRRVASLDSDALPGAEVVIPGTRDLPGGVYFARASDGVHVLGARVLVLR
jgi:hypothetical protein